MCCDWWIAIKYTQIYPVHAARRSVISRLIYGLQSPNDGVVYVCGSRCRFASVTKQWNHLVPVKAGSSTDTPHDALASLVSQHKLVSGWGLCVRRVGRAVSLVCVSVCVCRSGGQPFKKGEACTECERGQFYCTDQMCDCKSHLSPTALAFTARRHLLYSAVHMLRHSTWVVCLLAR